MIDEKNMQNAAEIPLPASPPPNYPEVPPSPPGHPYPIQQPAPGSYYVAPGQPGVFVPPQSPSQQQQLPTNYSPGSPQPQPTAVYVAGPVPTTGAQFQQELWARCARGEHDYETKHGVCGIITAIVFFPIGLLCLFADVEKRCSRCGARA